MVFKEAHIVEFLRKNASRADYILAGKKRFFILRGMWRITYRFVPIIYGLCALMGWSLNPAEWGLFIRFMGVSGIVILCLWNFIAGSICVEEAKDWLEQHGKVAIFKD